MTRRHIQPKRWTIQWSQNIRELVGQLHRFERLTYDSLSTIATEIIQQVDSVDGLNLGSGARVFVERLDNYLRFRTLRASTGMTVAENGNHIDFACTVAPDPLSFDLIWRGDDDPPGDQGGSVVNGRLLISAETVDAGNQAAALVSRMAHGGVVRWMRKTSVTEALEVHVGTPTDETDYLSFPIFGQFQTRSPFVVTSLAVEDEYRQLEAGLNHQDVDISPDGRHMLLVRSSGDTIAQYYLEIPWRPASGTLVNEYVTTALDGTPTCARWSPTGERVYWTGAASSSVYQYDCAPPYTMVDGVDSGASIDVSSQGTTPLSLAVSTAETSILVVFSNDSAFRYAGTAADLSTFSYASDTINLATVTGVSSEFHGMHMDATNRILFVTSSGAAGASRIHRLTLASAATLAGGTQHSVSSDLQSVDTDFRGVCVSPDGQFFVVIGNGNSRVYRFSTRTLTEAVTYRVAFVPIALGTATCATDFEDGSTVDFVEFNVPVYGLRKDVAVNCTPRTGLVQTGHAVYGHSAFVRDDDELCIRVIGDSTLLCGAHRLIWDVEQHGSYLTPSIHETPTSSAIIGPTAPATFLNDTGVIVASAGDVDFDLSSWGLQSGDDLFMHVLSDTNISLIGDIGDQGWVDVIQFATGGSSDRHLFYKRWGEDGQTDDDIFTLTEAGPTDWAAAIVAFRGAGGVRSGIIGRGVWPYQDAFRTHQDTNTSLFVPASLSQINLPQWPGAINLAFVHTEGTASLGAPSGGTEIYNAAVGTHGRMGCVQLSRGVSATMTIGASQPWVAYVVALKPARLT